MQLGTANGVTQELSRETMALVKAMSFLVEQKSDGYNTYVFSLTKNKNQRNATKQPLVCSAANQE